MRYQARTVTKFNGRGQAGLFLLGFSAVPGFGAVGFDRMNLPDWLASVLPQGAFVVAAATLAFFGFALLLVGREHFTEAVDSEEVDFGGPDFTTSGLMDGETHRGIAQMSLGRRDAERAKRR